MAMVLADPEMLDRLAKSMDSKAGEIPRLSTRARTLQVSSQVSGLTQLAAWLGDTAKDLRSRARMLRSPSESPFESLSAFGLPDGLAEKGEGNKLAPGLQKVLNAHKRDTPKERAQAVKDYFDKLSPAQGAALAAAKPKTVGNLDGVPAKLRFAANRISIQEEYEKESNYLNGLAKNNPAYKRTKDRVDTLRGFMNRRVKTVRDPDTRRKVEIEVPRQFLVFDAHFGTKSDAKSSPYADGRVAEVVGELESAKNVAFRVPGITNRLDNFDSFSRDGYQLMDDGKGLERTDSAVVSWMGYDTPEVGDSVDPAKAEVGGKQLADFRQGVSVNLQEDANVNIFAHSYGTLVTSKALQKGMKDIDSVVFMGSPGLGPNINSVADFNMPSTKFYAMRAPEDPVSYTQGHGKDPADFKDITRLATDGAINHSEYYKEGTKAQANLQRILFKGSKHLELTHTTLDQEMVGAAEVRKLVTFLHSKIPPKIVIKMGADLDPIVQNILNGRMSIPEALGPIHGILNKHNMLDRVKPEDLKNELTYLSGELAHKQAYQGVKNVGAPDWVANIAANGSQFTVSKLLDVVTYPEVKMLEIDRLQNNVRQLFGDTGKSIADESVKVVDSVIDFLTP
ncbi:alpha/beta hydrolase [Streptomyces halobius]|uniref:Alpha/beta hydrolase family protein n=1 Tax=Streptomyces halobius TaxID=2879846 RepID=A0ABY4MAB7_9ACTN|nr:alpha/beta hydrolase [Streptomyces halobius]UQA93734.1 alpha/beta hydrolase family protein [Streptomyces halobius]